MKFFSKIQLLLVAFALSLSGLAFIAPATSAEAATRGPSASHMKAMEGNIKTRTNNDRKKYRAKALQGNSCLKRYATAQAKRQASKKKMYHQSLTPVLRACNMNVVGENVAVGFTHTKPLQKAWMKSPGHKRNIIDKRFNRMGIGVAKASNGRLYYAVVFGRLR